MSTIVQQLNVILKFVIIIQFIYYKFLVFPSISCLVWRLTVMTRKGWCVVKHQTNKQMVFMKHFSPQMSSVLEIISGAWST